MRRSKHVDWDDDDWDEPRVAYVRPPRRVAGLQRAASRARTVGHELLAAERRAESERAQAAARARMEERARAAEEAERETRQVEARRIAEYLAQQPRTPDDVIAVARAICTVAGIAPDAIRELLAEAYSHGEVARMIQRQQRTAVPRNPYVVTW